ncbi:MAG: OmpA family protein [Bacteroidia bacterium]|nr:OmpA family protein [Bacteroidia bacterium]
MKKFSLVLISCIFFAVACVPERLLEESKSKLKNCETERDVLKKESDGLTAELAEAKEQLKKDQKTIDGLKRDTSINGSSHRALTAKYEKLNLLNDQLMDRMNKIMAGHDSDNSKLSGDLQNTREQLLRKQDTLRALETRLNAQRVELDNLNTELKKREARVSELEELLKNKDKAAADLKKKLSDALFNFENKGLTITQKNGKVYVSMDENLLFASGKTGVEPRGVEALKNLARVLEQNPDINVMVEGHTDDVPMKGSGEIKDNWDLSVMRATSVTKIILGSAKVDARRVTACGRGEFVPLDTAKTPEARKKNRRTEIILTPKLDELLKVLDTN